MNFQYNSYILRLLNEKISKNKQTACYYSSFKDCLTGPNWNSSNIPENYKSIDLLSKYDKTSDALKNIIKFISLLDFDIEIENYFFYGVLYFETELSQFDVGLNPTFILLAEKNDMAKTVSNFIKILNVENRKYLINKKYNN